MGMDEKNYLSRDERECRSEEAEDSGELFDTQDLVSGLSVYDCYMNFVEDSIGCKWDKFCFVRRYTRQI